MVGQQFSTMTRFNKTRPPAVWEGKHGFPGASILVTPRTADPPANSGISDRREKDGDRTSDSLPGIHV